MGQRLTLDAGSSAPVVFDVIAANGNGAAGALTENDRSIVLVLHFGTFDGEFGGDLAGDTTSGVHNIESLIAGAVGQIEIYKVHHHGSATSSNTAWMNAIHPKVAVLSVGSPNAFNHPTQAALDRIRATGAVTYWTTPGDGAPAASAFDIVASGTIAVDVPTTGTTFTVRHGNVFESYASSGAAAPQPAMSLDAPNSNSTVGRNVSIAGWAIDRGALTGTGVDEVVAYAYGSNGAAQFLGSATYGVARPDIGGVIGRQFTNSGFRMTATITPPDTYSIVAFMHSTVTGSYSAGVSASNVVVQASTSNATLYIDAPAPGGTVSRPFTIAGWAVDQGATTGTGIDAIALWAFPTSGAPATLVGLANYGLSRSDIGALVGDVRFTNSGYSMAVNSANLPTSASYDLIVFGRSTVTGSFTAARVVRVTVQ